MVGLPALMILKFLNPPCEPHHTNPKNETDKQLIAANKLAEYEFHEPEWTRISSEAKVR